MNMKIATVVRDLIGSLKFYIVLSLLIIFTLLVTSGIFSFGSAQKPLITISFLAAFAGGFLALISPCSAAMLPVFFAYSFKQKKELVKMTFIFYLGLATIFIPLGFSASLISKFFITNQGLLFNIAGAIFIVLGVMIFLGKSWQWLPERLRRLPKGRGIGTVYLMGVLFAFASGTCAAPIIGGIYTLASTTGNSLHAIFLLLTFALGLVMPLFIMAWFFDRYNFAKSKFIQGKSWELRFGTKRIYLHSTNIITSFIFITIGLIFILSKGTNALLGLFGASGLGDLYFELSDRILIFTANMSNWPFVVIAVLVMIFFVKRYFYKSRV